MLPPPYIFFPILTCPLFSIHVQWIRGVEIAVDKNGPAVVADGVGRKWAKSAMARYGGVAKER